VRDSSTVVKTITLSFIAKAFAVLSLCEEGLMRVTYNLQLDTRSQRKRRWSPTCPKGC
jgi:hypothetical protein